MVFSAAIYSNTTTGVLPREEKPKVVQEAWVHCAGGQEADFITDLSILSVKIATSIHSFHQAEEVPKVDKTPLPAVAEAVSETYVKYLSSTSWNQQHAGPGTSAMARPAMGQRSAALKN